MKLKAFFESKSKQGKISNEEFNKVVETLPDLEIPDVWVNLFDQEFMTAERALSEPKVYNKIRAEQLDAVDKIITDYLPLVDDKAKVDIQNEKSTFNKLKMLKDGFSASLEKVKTENPSNDEKIKELNKNNQELVNRLAAEKKQWEVTLTEKEKKFEEEKKAMKLDWTLDKKVGEYTFADEYKDVKTHLTKTIVDKIKTENVLIQDDTGNILVHEKTESGATKQKFNGNDPVTLDKLLEEPLKPFLKKNNAGDKPPAPGQRSAPTGRQTNLDGLDPNKMTLQQLRASGIRTL